MTDRHARHRRPDADRRRRPVDGFRVADPRRFERLVHDALATLPPDLLRELDRIQVDVDDLPPRPLDGTDGEVALGRYEAASRLTPPSDLAGPPDRITLFRRPIEARATNRAELAEIVRITVVQELADHLGLDEDRLDELGWG